LHLGNAVFYLGTLQLVDEQDRPIKVRIQSLRVLEELASRNGETVDRDDLIAAVWAGRAVSDDSLVQCIKDIRAALGDDDRQLVRTAVGRGYSLHGVRENTIDAGVHPKVLISRLRVDGNASELHELTEMITEELVIAVSPRVGLKVTTDTTQRETALYAITGRASLVGCEIRVFIQMAKGQSGDVAFAKTWSLPVNEVDTLPRQIADKIASVLRVHMFNHAGEDHISRENEDLNLQELLGKAAYHMSRIQIQDRDVARSVMSQAVEREPSNPMVLAMRASSAVISILQEGYAKLPDPPDYCLELADRAVGMAPHSDFVLLTRGCMRLWLKADHEGARSDFLRSLEISPVFHLAHQFLGISEILTGDHASGILRIKKVIELGPATNPRYPHYLSLIALGQILAGETEAAEQTSRESHERAPNDPWCNYVYATAVADRETITAAEDFQRMITSIDLPFTHFRDLPFTDFQDVDMLEGRLSVAGYPRA
jgi:DNA-binding winged helix-turn-helix (wHTH) protein